ncbi:MAG: DUF559 domain-containing protein [Ilumatobacter sp.]|uniref:DUF559 domain-containing protein n=1 Tax=Ilumatobacter sp. TaxID=1967498 RepID=UPI003C71DDF3
MRLTDHDAAGLRQHGLITPDSSGLSRSAWYRALRAGSFEQIHPGVARLVGTPRTYRQRTAAAVIAVGRSARALASHRSASALWLDRDGSAVPLGAKASDPEPPVDLIVGRRGHTRSLDGVQVHHPTDLARLTPQTVDGIRCTNILRTLLDLGAVATNEVHPLLGHALTTKLVNLDAVETDLLEQAKRGRSGAVALRAAVGSWEIDAKPADSVLELAFHRLVARFDLPPVEFHPVVEGWEVDFRFVGTRVLIECDGWATHGLERGQFERDRRRDADLAAAGWLVSRHSYRAVTNESAATARRLRALLALDDAA